MNATFSLLNEIQRRTAKVAVLGLGHVGLPTALMFSRAGFNVTGIDIDAIKVHALKQGTCYVKEPGLQEALTACLKDESFHATSELPNSIKNSSFVSICVPTPIESNLPDLRAFRAALSAVRSSAHKQMIILIESTVPPGTTSQIVLPEIQCVSDKIDDEIFVAYCPERITPVHVLEELSSNTRIIGGVGPNSSKIAAEFFKTICKQVIVTNPITAEIVKLAENTFRDLNIAYANSLALIAEHLGADVDDVIKLANTHPRVTIHRPGLGVGGPCLPKDPHILISGVPEDYGQLIRLARKVNDAMPSHAVRLLTQNLKKIGMTIKGAKVAVLGLAYKADTEDMTNSPAIPLIEELLEAGASAIAYDPHVPPVRELNRAPSIDDALKGADAVVVVTPHTEFRSIRASFLRSLVATKCIVFDTPRMFDPTEIENVGLTYLGTGYSSSSHPQTDR
jgi:UDP-N-acetyl-D-mannosaminuronic acid dehydrogenase